ncbi:MAG: hypothetical protein PVJ33_00600 [Lysobacterales bacterium]|jgi:hypothetical protein
MRILLAILALSLLVDPPSARAAVPETAAGDEVSLDAADQGRLGLRIAPLETTDAAESTEAIARVLDVGSLAQLDAEIMTAEAASAASAAEVKRLTVLAAEDVSASLRELETARVQAAADQSRLALARQRLALEWPAAEALSDAKHRRALIDDVAGGRAALVRVDPLGGSAPAAGKAYLQLEEGKPPLQTSTLGRAAKVDPRLQTEAWIVVVRGPAAGTLRPGRVLSARIESNAGVTGVLVPRSALVRADGATWVYVARDNGRFARRQVIAPRIRDDGWVVSSGFEPGERVVVDGAGALLAIERGGEDAEDD